MARKRSFNQLIDSELSSKIAFGESKYKSKIDNNLNFGESDYRIYSYSTYNTYKDNLHLFSSFVKEKYGINNFKSLEETEKYAVLYLQHCKDNLHCSNYTLKMRRSALCMLYSHKIDFDIDKRSYIDVKRSREKSVWDSHYNLEKGKYSDLAYIVKATSCRRCDISKLKKENFFEKDGLLFCEINKSKGGRNRISVVPPCFKERVLSILENKNDGVLFNKIPEGIDIHSLRREYAKTLYDSLNDKDFFDIVQKEYPHFKEYRKRNNKIVEVKKTTYKLRDFDVEIDRHKAQIVSKCLGHNRIDTSICHYLV